MSRINNDCKEKGYQKHEKPFPKKLLVTISLSLISVIFSSVAEAGYLFQYSASVRYSTGPDSVGALLNFSPNDLIIGSFIYEPRFDAPATQYHFDPDSISTFEFGRVLAVGTERSYSYFNIDSSRGLLNAYKNVGTGGIYDTFGFTLYAGEGKNPFPDASFDFSKLSLNDYPISASHDEAYITLTRVDIFSNPLQFTEVRADIESLRISVIEVPEPSILPLLVIGLAAFWLSRRVRSCTTQTKRYTATNKFLGVPSSRALLASMILMAAQNASAIPVDFTFSLNKPLVHGFETLGSSESPVIFKFRVDSDSPDLNEPSTEDDLFELESGSVQIGGERSDFLLGVFGVREEIQGDGITASMNRGNDGSLIAGRSLFVALVHLFDFSGNMLSDTDLPLDDTFGAKADFGMFRLTFRPIPSDPEFKTGDYVHYDAFPITSSDFTVRREAVAQVSEPNLLSLFVVPLLLMVWLRRSPLLMPYRPRAWTVEIYRNAF